MEIFLEEMLVELYIKGKIVVEPRNKFNKEGKRPVLGKL